MEDPPLPPGMSDRGIRLCSSLGEEHAQRPCRSPAITTHYGSRHDPEVSTSLEITRVCFCQHLKRCTAEYLVFPILIYHEQERG